MPVVVKNANGAGRLEVARKQDMAESHQAEFQSRRRLGHGSGEGRGTTPGEVHDIALKAAETDATKRAFATFGRPFGLKHLGIYL